MARTDRQRTGAGASSSRLASVACLCLVLASVASAGASAIAVGGGEGHGAELVQRQLASSADADGNTVVYSVDPAGTTTTLETIEAGAVPVTTSAAPGVGGGQDAGRVTGTEASVNLGQQTAPASTGSTRPPTTYLAYSTNAGGEQITLTQTFTPISILPSSSPQAPLVGTVLDYSSYLPVPTNSAGVAVGAAGPNAKKFSRQNGKVAAVGVLLSVLAGALVVL